MTRICCNTADDQPHAERCTFAIGNSLNRPCAKHSIRGCPACRREAEGAHAAPAEPSIHAPARETGPFHAAGNMVYRSETGMVFVRVDFSDSVSREGREARAQQIADGLNMLHHVRAGTAGTGAPEALDERSKWALNGAGILTLGNGSCSDISALLAAAGWKSPAQVDEIIIGPLPLVLHCPACGEQHIDAPDEASGWTNPPHKSHLCHGCGCIWRPAEVPTNGVPGLTATGRADNWFPGSATSLDARIAVMDALAGVRDDFTTPDAAAALDEAMRRVTELCGIGLPEQPRAPGDLGEWVTSRRFPEHGVLRVTAFIIGADGFCEVMAMSDDPAIERVAGPFWDFQRAEAPPTRYAWDSEPPPFAADLPTFTVNMTGVTTQAQARRQAEHRHRHDLAGILAPFPEPERFIRQPCGEGLECPGDGSPFELRGGGLFQDGKRIASCETPEAGCLLIAALAVAESAASLDHPVEQLRAYLRSRVGSDRVDHEALDEARRYMDASAEPYRADGQTVYQGKRRVAHCPAADGYNDTRRAVRDAESIALALNTARL